MSRKGETIKSNEKFTSNLTMRIQLGDVCCSLRILDENGFHIWRGLFDNFLTDRPVDLSIEIDFVERIGTDKVESAFEEAVFSHNGNHFTTSNGTIEGEYDISGRKLRLTVEKGLLNPYMEQKPMNRLICLAYNTACKLRFGGQPRYLLVHGCGVVRHGRALLFTGPCGAGKSTIGRLCGDRDGRVLNDEIVLVSRPNGDGNPLIVQGVPILGDLPQRLNEAAPLFCVLMLKQSERAAVRRLDRMEAYLRFMRQVINPAYVGQTGGREAYSLIAAFSDEVTATTLFYELEFTLDGELLWDVVGELERLLDRGGELDGRRVG